MASSSRSAVARPDRRTSPPRRPGRTGSTGRPCGCPRAATTPAQPLQPLTADRLLPRDRDERDGREVVQLVRAQLAAPRPRRADFLRSSSTSSSRSRTPERLSRRPRTVPATSSPFSRSSSASSDPSWPPTPVMSARGTSQRRPRRRCWASASRREVRREAAQQRFVAGAARRSGRIAAVRRASPDGSAPARLCTWAASARRTPPRRATDAPARGGRWRAAFTRRLRDTVEPRRERGARRLAVLVPDRAARVQDDPPGHAQAVVRLLAVHEDRLVEAAEGEELVAAHHHQRAGGRRHVDRLAGACARGRPSPRPYVAVFGRSRARPPRASRRAASSRSPVATATPASSSSSRSGASQPCSTRRRS